MNESLRIVVYSLFIALDALELLDSGFFTGDWSALCPDSEIVKKHGL